MRNGRWLLSWALAPLFGLPLSAQPVISARAGLIEFSDGVVFLNGNLLEQVPGRFDQMKEGSELRTEAGRAELMLTPGVFLRIADNSAVQMVANRLSDTRVRLVAGSAIVDATNAAAKTSATMLYGDYQIQIGQDGHYRLNSEPAELRVEDGKAQVQHNGNSLSVDAGHVVALTGGLTARLIKNTSPDRLDDWSQTRSDAMAQSNQEAAHAQDLSNAIDQWQNDPASALSASGMSGYLPPPGYIPTAPYTGWVSSPYTPLGIGPMNPWGYGVAGIYGPYGVYGPYNPYIVPVYRNDLLIRPSGVVPYRYPGAIRPSIPTGVGAGTSLGIGRAGIYGGGVSRPMAPAPMHGGVGAGRVGGGHR